MDVLEIIISCIELYSQIILNFMFFLLYLWAI